MKTVHYVIAAVIVFIIVGGLTSCRISIEEEKTRRVEAVCGNGMAGSTQCILLLNSNPLLFN